MRKIIENQQKFGQVSIDKIPIDLRSRDEIPQVLLGLQTIYSNKTILDDVLQLLLQVLPDKVNMNNGRPGMDLWNILVLGTIRLNCNWDYDKVHDIANNHRTIRQFLNLSPWDDKQYSLQSIKDNVLLFTPDILDKINEIVVRFGIHEFQKNKDEGLKTRCDSFVVETNVRFPIDTILLFDSVRKVLTLISRELSSIGITLWRQSDSIIKKLKKKLNKTLRIKRSRSKNKEQKQKRKELICKIHKEFIEFAKIQISRAKHDIQTVNETLMIEKLNMANMLLIDKFIGHADRQINQIERRVLKGEKIPHSEKVFSIFEEHTEWIKKGKAGVPVELGLGVCVVEDQNNFILHHHVMQQEKDRNIALKMVRETKKKFPQLNSMSFDGGFYSVANERNLKKELDFTVLPKKGKLSDKEREMVRSERYIKAKNQHSAIESAINGLENHGLDICPDRGIEGFKRYVSLAVLARNIQILGAKVKKRKIKQLKRLENQTLKKAA